MIKLENENILKTIFKSINLSIIKQLIRNLNNKYMTYNLIRILSYENIYKTLGKTVASLENGSRRVVFAVVVLPNGNLISSCLNILNIWDMITYKCIKTIQDKFIISLMILLPNNILVTSSTGGQLKFWDINNQYTCIKQISIEKWVYKLFILSNGKLACFSSIDVTDEEDGFPSYYMTLINYNNVYSTVEVKNHPYIVMSLANLPENRLACGVESKAYIVIWDVLDNGLEHFMKLEGHKDSVKSLLYVEKEKLLLSGAYDNAIRVWDLNDNYSCLRVVNFDATATYLELLRTGYLAVGFSNGLMRILNLSNFKCVNTLKTKSSEIDSILLLNDNKIGSIQYGEEIFVWDI
jgi:WD40 repeat protein